MNEVDPRVKRTRKLLRDALVSLLAEKSFQSISVQDIAERATLNRATFYAHFEDKYALMDYVVRETFRAEIEQRVGDPRSFTASKLHLLVMTVCEFMGAFQGHCAPPTSSMNPPIEAKVQDELHIYLLEWLRHDHQARSDAMQPDAMAMIMSWAIFGAGIQWSRTDRTIPSTTWARQVVAVLPINATQDNSRSSSGHARATQ